MRDIKFSQDLQEGYGSHCLFSAGCRYEYLFGWHRERPDYQWLVSFLILMVLDHMNLSLRELVILWSERKGGETLQSEKADSAWKSG